jgi:hypothetical protein
LHLGVDRRARQPPDDKICAGSSRTTYLIAMLPLLHLIPVETQMAVETIQKLSPKWFFWVAASQAAEKVFYSVIPSEARNLSSI